MHDLRPHIAAIAPGVGTGRVIPLLGAGVSLSARGLGESWGPGTLPSGYEFAAYLASKFEFPDTWENPALSRVASYVEAVAGRVTLYDELHDVFAADYVATPVHRFLARLPSWRERKGLSNRGQVVVTTNYDDMMERAFQDAGEQYDVVWYVADGDDRGKFIHRRYQGEVRTIDTVREYQDLDLDLRSLVLKIHGSVDRIDPNRDSYVITDDDYLEYLIRADFTTLLPQMVVARLYSSQFLFLGYGLQDWNLQVILHRMWREQRLASKSWAVQYNPSEVDRLLWGRRNVEMVESPLDEYTARLDDRLTSSPE